MPSAYCPHRSRWPHRTRKPNDGPKARRRIRIGGSVLARGVLQPAVSDTLPWSRRPRLSNALPHMRAKANVLGLVRTGNPGQVHYLLYAPAIVVALERTWLRFGRPSCAPNSPMVTRPCLPWSNP